MTGTLDERLDRSAPAITPRSADRNEALRGLIVATRPRRRGRLRAGAAVAGGLALLGIGGVAAADALGWKSWWADDAVGEQTYTLPSGAMCEGILGNFRGDAEAVAVAEEFMARPDLLEIVDIDQALADVYADTHVTTRSDGSKVPAGPGTPYWSEDEAYRTAVDIATSNAVFAEVRSQGLDSDGMSFQGESRCPDAVAPELAPGTTRGGAGD